MFNAFGEIELVDVFEEIFESEKNVGLAVMIFQRGEDALSAIKKMNGYIVNEVPIRVEELPNDVLTFYDWNKHMDLD